MESIVISTETANKLNELINTAEKIVLDEIKGHKGIRVVTILENAKGILEKEGAGAVLQVSES